MKCLVCWLTVSRVSLCEQNDRRTHFGACMCCTVAVLRRVTLHRRHRLCFIMIYSHFVPWRRCSLIFPLVQLAACLTSPLSRKVRLITLKVVIAQRCVDCLSPKRTETKGNHAVRRWQSREITLAGSTSLCVQNGKGFVFYHNPKSSKLSVIYRVIEKLSAKKKAANYGLSYSVF